MIQEQFLGQKPATLYDETAGIMGSLVEVDVLPGPGQLVVLYISEPGNVEKYSSEDMLSLKGKFPLVEALVTSHGKANDAELVKMVSFDILLAAVVQNIEKTDV